MNKHRRMEDLLRVSTYIYLGLAVIGGIGFILIVGVTV